MDEESSASSSSSENEYTDSEVEDDDAANAGDLISKTLLAVDGTEGKNKLFTGAISSTSLSSLRLLNDTPLLRDFTSNLLRRRKIAVVGCAVRFPGVSSSKPYLTGSLEYVWRQLVAGR